MTEKIPAISFSVEWRMPTQATTIVHRISSDAAISRLRDVVYAAIDHALVSKGGEAAVVIIVNRLAKNPIERD